MRTEPSQASWRATFLRCYPRAAGALGLLAFGVGAVDSQTASDFGAALLGSLVTVALAAVPVAVYAYLDRWRAKGRLQHYLTWIAVCAVPLVPLALIFQYGLQQVPGVTSADVGGGPLILLSAVLMGTVLGSLAESIERQQRKADATIAERAAAQPRDM
jgi:hypothetical protein